MDNLSISNILNEIPSNSKLAKHCISQPSFQIELINRVESLSAYYRSQSEEAISSFFDHLRHFKDDPDQYLAYDTELRFAEMLLRRQIKHCFLSESKDVNPDIEVIHNGKVLYCEIASIQGDGILNAVMDVEEQISKIPSGQVISLCIPSLDQEDMYEHNLQLINEAGRVIEDSLTQKNYLPIRREEFEVEFTHIDNSSPSELSLPRTVWEKTDWINEKLYKTLIKKCNQLESKPNTILVWWNHDPRMMDFAKAIHKALTKDRVPKFAGVLLVDRFLDIVSFPNPNIHNSSEILLVIERAIKR